MAKLGILNIEGQSYALDDLELDDLEELEDMLGAPLNEVNFGSAKSLKATAYIVLRNHRENFTLEDAGKLKVSAMMGDDDSEDDEEEAPVRPPDRPTPPNGSPGGKPESAG